MGLPYKRYDRVYCEVTLGGSFKRVRDRRFRASGGFHRTKAVGFLLGLGSRSKVAEGEEV